MVLPSAVRMSKLRCETNRFTEEVSTRLHKTVGRYNLRMCCVIYMKTFHFLILKVKKLLEK